MDELLRFGNEAVSWLTTNPHPNLPVDELELHTRIWTIYKSQDKTSKTSLLKFLNLPTLLCNGEERPGCTSLETGVITIAGQFWSNATTTPMLKCSLALTELLRTQQKIKMIYKKAPELCTLLGYDKDRSEPQKTLPVIQPPVFEISRTCYCVYFDRTRESLDLEINYSDKTKKLRRINTYPNDQYDGPFRDSCSEVREKDQECKPRPVIIHQK